MNWIIEAKAFEYDKHYSDCKKNNQPFIKARINRDTGNYLVFLDMATCDSNLSEKKMNKLRILFDSESDAPKKSSITSELCTFDGIPAQKLNRFLSLLYDTIQLTE